MMGVLNVSARKVNLFSQEDHLSPLPVPTGQKPSDLLSVIWCKNKVYIDVGSYSVGAGVMVLWPLTLIFLVMNYYNFAEDDYYIIVLATLAIVVIPWLLILSSLFKLVPLPLRFNRQRREVCVPRENGKYWIVPWETVTAIASQHSSISQVGKTSAGMLFVGFTNPDIQAKADNQHCYWGFNCGGGESSMQLWECMRSYMEIGLHAVTDNTARFYRPKGILASYAEDVVEAAQRKGWFMALLWEGFFGLFIFNTLLIDVLERMKLSPPPDLPYPEIIEWSKPLPPDQWTKRSPELEVAIARREAELGIRSS